MFRTSAGTRGGIGPHAGRAQGMLAVFAFTTGCTGEPSPRSSDPSAPPHVDVEPCAETSRCLAFPSEPIAQGPTPRDVELLFAGRPDDSRGVCLIEPPDGALFPKDGLPPRFRFQPLPGEDLWKITLSSQPETHALVVYTTRPQWTMDEVMWHNLTTHIAGRAPVHVTVQGVDSRGGLELSQTTASFEIAPVEAGGTIVYWAATGAYNAGGETKLVGFRLDRASTIDVLRPENVEEAPTLNQMGDPKTEDGEDPALTGRVRCIGCHASTPEGDAVAFVDNWPWNSVVASIASEDIGQRPAYVTQAASRVLQQPWQGAPAFSKAHWGPDNFYMVQSFGNDVVGWPQDDKDAANDDDRDRLIWFDLAFDVPAPLPASGEELHAAVQPLEGEAFGFIDRNGDERGAVNPTWSHDGETIAYVSASRTLDGHAGGRFNEPEEEVKTDIYQVPFNGGDGGDAVGLEGASYDEFGEYYPDYSADDAWVAFTRADSIRGPVYYRPDGEIYIVPSSGGTPTRLAANEPPSCTGQASPGIINSWPKWSPTVQEADGKTYYWLIFSSARAYVGQFTLPQDEYSPKDTRSSQLYLAPVVVGPGGEVTTYPAIYLYNQTTNTTNLTPAWDEFQIYPEEVQ
ncbi:MAG TPA: hypothetical protein VFU02_13785 [Polyangiaceae bacterium]|nr:hypothetical protein [Polyangiaceae bacterium]